MHLLRYMIQTKALPKLYHKCCGGNIFISHSGNHPTPVIPPYTIHGESSSPSRPLDRPDLEQSKKRNTTTRINQQKQHSSWIDGFFWFRILPRGVFNTNNIKQQ